MKKYHKEGRQFFHFYIGKTNFERLRSENIDDLPFFRKQTVKGLKGDRIKRYES